MCKSRRAGSRKEVEMFNNNKTKRIVATVIAIILVLAMVIPLAISAVGYF